MELYIFDSNRELAGIVESFEYLRWTRRYSQCGSFELKAIATLENIALLKEGNILWKSDDEEAGLIEHLELSQTGSEIITVRGRFATAFLARRIVWETETLSGDISACVEQLLDDNLISPTDPARQITSIMFSSPNLGIPVSAQISYRDLMEAVTELCDTADIGIKTVFDPATGIFTVTLYSGATSQAVFAKEYENLTEQIYMESAADYANTALIGGEGEGAERIFVAITSSSGEARREIFVDAKDLQEDDFGIDYTDALIFRGQSKLSELAVRYSFDASVNPHGNLVYKTDFDLGQTVKVFSKAWGVSMLTRITEVEETYEADGQSISVTFGKAELTIAQKLRSDMSQVKTALLAPTGISEVVETLGDLTEVYPQIQGDTVTETINNLFGKLPVLEPTVGAGTISVGQYALHSMVPGDSFYFTSWSGNKFSDQPSDDGHVFLIKHAGDDTGNGYQRAMGFFISRNTMTFYAISVYLFNNPAGQANWLSFPLGALTDIAAAVRGTTFAASINNVYNAPVSGTRIADGAVTSAKIANGTITGTDIATNTITASNLVTAFTDYSTTEQNTGRKWTDGKTIYRKVVNLGSLPNAVPGNTAHGIANLSAIISVTGMATNGTVYLPLPLARYNNFASQIGLYADTTNVVVEPGTDRTAYTGFAVIEYTKTI